MEKHVVVSLSGGMDSSTLLLRCLKEYDTVTAISFDYGQKHNVELERAKDLVKYINENPSRLFHHDHAPNGFEETYPLVKHQVIELKGLSELLNSASKIVNVNVSTNSSILSSITVILNVAILLLTVTVPVEAENVCKRPVTPTLM